jgi:molybdopterin synthase catalytic subunit
MTHWTQKCTRPEGHHVDNQGACHSCGAEQVPDSIVVVMDVDHDFEAAFSTYENAIEYLKHRKGRMWALLEVALDEGPVSLGEMLKQQLAED